jgi:NAD(P)-dependent dehydrogenase (short-subunit alcohol dehydrogenase family)
MSKLKNIFDLTGKVVLITGGNGGIGFGMAQAVAQAGADVIIWGTNETKNSQAKEDLEKTGRKVLALKCDVSNEKEVEDSMNKSFHFLGKLNVIVANSGIIGHSKGITDIDAQDFRRVLQVNLDGTFFTFKHATKYLISQGTGGSLIAVSSMVSLFGSPGGEHYAASKLGQIALTNSLAVELARHGIRANSILPGWIETGMTAGALPSSGFQNKVLPRVPMRRWGQPSDFGGIIVYLSSDASSYHTGDSIIIDGGYSKF